MQCEGFEAIVGDQPEILILGTMPSVKSIEEAFYYAHPRNGFWPILADYFQLPIDTIAQKRALIEQSRLALWDVLQACERSGSLDSAIRQPIANDFSALFEAYPTLRWVLLNGKTAEKLFKQFVLSKQSLPENVNIAVLPSTSPANAQMTLEKKKAIWHQTLNDAFKSQNLQKPNAK